MAYQEVRSDAMDIKKEAGIAHEGVYIGHKEITTEIGKQQVYKFRTRQGRVFSIYGFTMLNLAMENVLTGSMCRITYIGTENVKTRFGMKDVHQVRVEVDDEFEGSSEDVNEPEIPF